MKKRVMSILLALCMALSILSATAWAGGQEGTKTVELTSLCVTNSDGERISLLETPVSVSLGKKYSFSTTFSHSNQVENVYIVSTKGSQSKRLEAIWDGSAFVTSGAFDGDENYAPGKISVEYTRKVRDVKVGDDVDWHTYQAALGDSCKAEVVSVSGEAVQAKVDLSKLLASEANVVFDVMVDVFDEASGDDLNEWLGYYHDLENMQKRILEGGEYYLYLDDARLSTYVTMVIRDVSGSRYTKLVLEEAGEHFTSLKEVTENLEGIGFISGLVYDSLAIQEDADKLREEIAANPSILESTRAELNAKVDAYENDRVYFTLLTSVLPAVVAATGGTMVGPAIAFNALVGVINAAAGTFWDYRIGMIRGCEPLDTSFTGVGGCGVPLTRDFLSNYDISKSGNYCLPEGASKVNVGIVDGESVDVTLCLHGKNVGSINVTGGSTLHLCDCMYSKNMDGTVSGGQVNGISIINNSGVTISSGTVGGYNLRNCLSSSGGNVIITGGTINGSIVATDSSRITVENGTILGGILAENSSEITINGGTIAGYPHDTSHPACSLEADNSDIIIRGGQISMGVWTNSGSICVHGGVVGRKPTRYIETCIVNEAGKVEIYNGTMLGRIINGESGTVYMSGGEVICTRLESDASAGDHSAIENTGGHIIIYGGLIKGEGKGTRQSGTRCIENSDGGTVTISSGNFYSSEGGCIDNTGELNIMGGTFRSYDTVIYNHADDRPVIIDDGMFQSLNGTCLKNVWGSICITDGTFVAAKWAVENSDGQLTVSNGHFYGNGGVRCSQGNMNYWPVVTITGGIFQAVEQAVYAIGGEIIISDGVFRAASDGYRNGAVVVGGDKGSISGGIFQNPIGYAVNVLNDKSTLVISNGYFEGTYGLWGKKEHVTLQIDQNSNIEINASAIAFPGIDWDGMWKCEAGEGYTGGVVLYSSANAKGSTLSIEEANERESYNKYGPYARLTAGPAPGDASASCTHSYSSTSTPPTCLTRGYTSYVCNRCGYTYTSDYVPAHGHSFGAWDTETEPTQMTAGVQLRKCATCGETEYRYINKKTLLPADVTFTMVNQADGSETVSLKNQLTSTLQAWFILAAYNEDGRMIGGNAVRDEIAPGKVVELTVKYSSKDSGVFTRAFLLEPVNFYPLCTAKDIG